VNGLPSYLAWAAIVGFYGMELVLRKGEAAKSLKASAADKGSTAVILIAYLVVLFALVTSLVLPGLQTDLPAALRWIGAIVAWVGICVRIVAIRTLGASYTRTLKVQSQQQIIRHGIYRRIRHPGYLASLLIWGGAAIGAGSAIASGISWLALFGAYGYRMKTEEHMLERAHGSRYLDYQRTTWRLIPYVY
jgi:protein-S-isoprenylcysteine O-methyltransferase Ste14